MTTRQKALAASVLGLLLAAGGRSGFFMRAKGLVAETLSLQTRLLAGELTARDRRSGVAQVTRNIDKMDRVDTKKVRDAFTAEWRRFQQQGVDDYFAADEADREALLDHDIDRVVTAGELWFATNPRSNGLAPRPRKPKNAAAKPGKTKVTQAAQLLDIYRTKLLARAGKRGVTLPDWLLGPR